MKDVKIVMAGATLVVSMLRFVIQHRTQMGKDKKNGKRK